MRKRLSLKKLKTQHLNKINKTQILQYRETRRITSFDRHTTKHLVEPKTLEKEKIVFVLISDNDDAGSNNVAPSSNDDPCGLAKMRSDIFNENLTSEKVTMRNSRVSKREVRNITSKFMNNPSNRQNQTFDNVSHGGGHSAHFLVVDSATPDDVVKANDALGKAADESTVEEDEDNVILIVNDTDEHPAFSNTTNNVSDSKSYIIEVGENEEKHLNNPYEEEVINNLQILLSEGENFIDFQGFNAEDSGSSRQTLNRNMLRKSLCWPEMGTSTVPYICEFCGKSYLRYCTFYAHIRNHKEINLNLRKHKCSECGKSFNLSCSLYMHVKKVHRKIHPSYVCAFCGLKSFSKEHMSAHEQTHEFPEGVEIPTPFKCFCGKSFISKHKLTEHRRFKHVSKKCPICSKEFPSLTGYFSHKRRFHSATGKTYVYKSNKKYPWLPKRQTCPMCSRPLSSIGSLNHHLKSRHQLRTTSSQRAIRCACGKAFGVVASFINHKREVHDEPVSASDLRAIHDKLMLEMPPPPKRKKPPHSETFCELCCKHFKNKNSLYSHKYDVHRAEDPSTLVCEPCDLRFVNRRAYNNHQNSVHTSIDKRTCDICNKQFKTQRSRWGHKFVHMSPGHCCPECGSLFKRRGDYTRHLKDKHGFTHSPTSLVD